MLQIIVVIFLFIIHPSQNSFITSFELTMLRRAEPLYSSGVLGGDYQYSQKQLERKYRHLDGYNITLPGDHVPFEAAKLYKDCIENMLSKPNLIAKEGTLSKEEPAMLFVDPETKMMIAFEANPAYNKRHFISSYKISDESIIEFGTKSNIGYSPAERKKYYDENQRARARQERIQQDNSQFYKNLPEDGRISNKQLRDVEAIKNRLKENPNFLLSDKQKNLVKRAEKFQHYKAKWNTENQDIITDEF